MIQPKTDTPHRTLRRPGVSRTLPAVVLAAVGFFLSRGVARAADYQRVIDDCYYDSGPNKSFACYFTQGKLRGRWSPRDCVVEASMVARDGDRVGARQWLKACACGDSSAQDAIEAAGEAAVDYAVSRYSNLSH